LRGLFQTKSLDAILASAADKASSLKRELGAWNITLLGVGAIIGAGIFATVGTAAAGDAVRPGAGPSLMLSFAITAVVCAFTALCYAEMAAMVPISGSAYTYSYATLGELVAWIIGWDLMIEYAIGNVAVAISWSGYFRSLIGSFGVSIPDWLATDYRTAAKVPGLLERAPHLFGVPIVFNILAFAIVMLITVVLIRGIRESANFNAGMVWFKILVLLIFVGLALYYVPPAKMAANWTPFQPNGWAGTFAGAAIVFFAFIGFDAVSTVAEETKNPERNLPIGILASLAACTFLYALVAGAFTGMMPYSELVTRLASEKAEPLTMALNYVAPGQVWATRLVGLGSVVATTAVLLVFQLGQPRIFFSMARDGLLPQSFAKIHPRYRTPHVTTWITGIVVALFAAVANIDEMVDLTNVGTLFAFILVCIAIPILRIKDPHRVRPFRVPFGPFILPGLGVLSCLFLMINLPLASWWRLFAWLVLGFAVYAAYGYSTSVIGRSLGRPQRTPGALRLAASGFLVLSIGLVTIPHDAGPGALMGIARDAGAAGHGRALLGLGLIAVGLLVGVGGVLAQRGTERAAP